MKGQIYLNVYRKSENKYVKNYQYLFIPTCILTTEMSQYNATNAIIQVCLTVYLIEFDRSYALRNVGLIFVLISSQLNKNKRI